MGERLEDPGDPDTGPVADRGGSLETEYEVLHRQRVALVRQIHLWHQIGWPASLLVIGFFIQQTTGASLAVGSRNAQVLLGAGTVLAIVAVWAAHFFALDLDERIRELYPRIVYLECLLGYDFYRNYLRSLGTAEQKFVEQAEDLTTPKDPGSWDEVRWAFDPEKFDPRRRRYGKLYIIGPWVLTVGYVLVAGYLILNGLGWM